MRRRSATRRLQSSWPPPRPSDYGALTAYTRDAHAVEPSWPQRDRRCRVHRQEVPSPVSRRACGREPPWLLWQALTAFLKSVYRDPTRAGAVAPSSSALSKRMASLVRHDASHVLEIGAGTGAFTHALLKRGIPPGSVWAVEIDPSLASFLEQQFPAVHVLCGKAVDLAALLPTSVQGRIDTVVSGLPMRNLSRQERRKTVASALQVLQPGGEFLQFTYGFAAPSKPKASPLKASA
jgi:phosphatidylethanolamine/phosphatidyl-N-methylethanolamine N-methyltransferase